jgi:hypothetical protein
MNLNKKEQNVPYNTIIYCVCCFNAKSILCAMAHKLLSLLSFFPFYSGQQKTTFCIFCMVLDLLLGLQKLSYILIFKILIYLEFKKLYCLAYEIEGPCP